jgi:biotin carboxylase
MSRILVLGIGPMRDRFFLAAAGLGLEAILVEESAYSRYDRLCDETYAWRLWDHGRPGPEYGRLEELRGRVDGVVALNDWSAPIAADLALRWGLPGAGEALAQRGHDKIAVRSALAAAGLDDTAHRLVGAPAHIDAFFAETGAEEVVLKPLDGGAGLGVRLASSAAEAKAVLAQVLAATGRDHALAEVRLVGQECSLEAVVRSGAVIASVVTEKVSTAPPRFIELRHLVNGDQDAWEATGVRGFLDGLVSALKVDDAVLHVEAVLTAAGWRLIEVALRPAGGLITDLVRLSTGIDLYAEQLLLATAQPPAVPARRAAPPHAGVQFAAGVGVVADAPSMFPVRDGLADVRFAERLLPPGTPVPEVNANWWRAGYVLGVGADLARLEVQLATATDRMLALVGLAGTA